MSVGVRDSLNQDWIFGTGQTVKVVARFMCALCGAAWAAVWPGYVSFIFDFVFWSGGAYFDVCERSPSLACAKFTECAVGAPFVWRNSRNVQTPLNEGVHPGGFYAVIEALTHEPNARHEQDPHPLLCLGT